MTAVDIALLLLLFGGPFVVGMVRAHFIRVRLELEQRTRCVLAEIDFERWEQGR